MTTRRASWCPICEELFDEPDAPFHALVGADGLILHGLAGAAVEEYANGDYRIDVL